MTATATAKDRVFNFSAGPATLPESVLKQAQHDSWNIFETGIGVMEHSHRGKAFDRVMEEAVADCREIGAISDDYEIMFIQGGATTQFGMIPMGFLGQGQTADYPDTGVWTNKAIKDAQLFGKVHVAYDGSQVNYCHIPNDGELNLTEGAAYLHYCSNNTIYGTRYNTPPKTTAPLVCDASSEMFSRPIDVNAHAMIYAGAQKNLGPAGVALVIMRRDFLETCNQDVMTMMNYKKIADGGSRLNTPPTFAIYMVGQVFKWILSEGGLAALEERNNQKAKLLYDVIDELDFYAGHSEVDCRSVMNVTFRTPNDELDSKFLAAAEELQMSGLKGHRKVGGIRASIYNAFPVAGCEALARFMKDFAAANG